LKIKCFFVLFFIFLTSFSIFSQIKAKSGIIDLTNLDFEKNISVNLNGDWEFYWQQLLNPEDFKKESQNIPLYFNAPNMWNNYKINNKNLGSYGFATFRLTILLSPQQTQTIYALKIMEMGTAYKLWINGELISYNGKVGKNKSEMIPQTIPKTLIFNVKEQKIELVLQISNFYDRNGGFWYNINFGNPNSILKLKERKMSFDLILFGSIFLMGLYHFVLYINRKKDKTSLYFSMFCIGIAIRTISTNEKLLFTNFSFIPYWLSIKIEYLSFYLFIIAFTLFFNSLFQKIIKKTILNSVLIISAICSFIVLVTPVNIFSQTLMFYQIFCIFLGFYILFVVIIGFIKKYTGSLLFLVGFLIFFSTAINDILYSNQIIQTTYLVSFGLFIFIALQSFVLSINYANAFNKIESLSNDLKRLNEVYSNFVPSKFLNYLGHKSLINVALGDHSEKEMSILFSDIRSFTALSETMTITENFRFINAYMGRVGPLVRKNNGFIDKYIGDGIMALFPDKAEDAINAAIEMQNKIRVYNVQREKNGYKPITAGTGIHTGNLMLGIIGEQERMEGTVISDAVNLSYRLEGLTKFYGCSIIISEITLSKIEDKTKYHYRFLGKVKVKGKKEIIPIYEIFDSDTEEIIKIKERCKFDLEMGIKLYYDKNFTEASILFKNIYDENPYDKTANFYFQKTIYLIEVGASSTWNGVENIDF